MLKRMNLAGWFMLMNALDWLFFWGRVWQKMILWDPQGKHTPYYLWLRIANHALPWGSEDRLMIGIVLAQMPVVLPLRRRTHSIFMAV